MAGASSGGPGQLFKLQEGLLFPGVCRGRGNKSEPAGVAVRGRGVAQSDRAVPGSGGLPEPLMTRCRHPEVRSLS